MIQNSFRKTIIKNAIFSYTNKAVYEVIFCLKVYENNAFDLKIFCIYKHNLNV